MKITRPWCRTSQELDCETIHRVSPVGGSIPNVTFPKHLVNCLMSALGHILRTCQSLQITATPALVDNYSQREDIVILIQFCISGAQSSVHLYSVNICGREEEWRKGDVFLTHSSICAIASAHNKCLGFVYPVSPDYPLKLRLQITIFLKTSLSPSNEVG